MEIRLSGTDGTQQCGKFISQDEYCELFEGHQGRCGLMPEHEHWFDRNGYCVTCGKDGGPEVYGP